MADIETQNRIIGIFYDKLGNFGMTPNLATDVYASVADVLIDDVGLNGDNEKAPDELRGEVVQTLKDNLLVPGMSEALSENMFAEVADRLLAEFSLSNQPSTYT